MKKFMKNKYKFYTASILMLVLTIVSTHFVYSISLLSGVETFIRITGSVVIVLLLITSMYFGLRVLLDKEAKPFLIYTIIILIYTIILSIISFNVSKVYSKLSNVSKSVNINSTSLVTMTSNEINELKDLDNGKIGVLNDEFNIEGYQIPKDIIKNKKLNNEVVYYDGYTSLIEALSSSEVKYIFLPTDYKIMFKEIDSLEKTLALTKIIYTEEKEIIVKNNDRGKVIDKPFTMLLMGVDSEDENIKGGSSFNGDALMVVTFNPKTLNTTIVSIPRDTYVPIACFSGQRKNKITHAAWYGEDCMTKTIEKFLEVKIDYFFKINFKGVVKLVDALGGINVNVPYSFCEQDSSRRWGKHTVYVKEGNQKLNGEQALALTRNRKNNASICGKNWGGSSTTNDFIRGQNQQLVVKGIMEKAKDIRKIDTLYEILDTISNSMETNMKTSEILSFYNIGKDIVSKVKNMKIDEIIGMERLFISGYDMRIFDYDASNNQGMRLELYNFVPYRGSVKDVVNAMKINLSQKELPIIKEFSFSVNVPYEEVIIGKGNYNESRIPLLPNFIGSDKSVATSYASKNKIKIDINYTTSTNNNHSIGEIINQSPYAKMDIDYVGTIKIDVVDKLDIKVDKPNDKINCSFEENKDNSKCLLPDFIGDGYSFVENWFNKLGLSIPVKFVEIKESDSNYDSSKSGLVVYQSKKSGISLYDLIGNSIEFKYMAKSSDKPIEVPKEPDDGDDDNPNIDDIIPST